MTGGGELKENVYVLGKLRKKRGRCERGEMERKKKFLDRIRELEYPFEIITEGN